MVIAMAIPMAITMTIAMAIAIAVPMTIDMTAASLKPDTHVFWVRTATKLVFCPRMRAIKLMSNSFFCRGQMIDVMGTLCPVL